MSDNHETRDAVRRSQYMDGYRAALIEAADRLTSKQDQVYGGAPSNSYLDGKYEAYEAAVDIVTGLLAEHPQEAP